LCEAEAGFSDPLLLGLCVLFALSHLLNSLRRLSTFFYRIRQLPRDSTRINVFRQRTTFLAGLESPSQAKNIGSGT
jgi:hypothetical protein